jgi:hypothetical protein
MTQNLRHQFRAGRALTLVAAAIGFQGMMLAPAKATPVTYNINFAPTQSNTALPTGVFVYDADVQQFSGFSVNWNGGAYNFVPSAMAPYDLTGGIYSQLCGTSGAALTFLFITNAACFSSIQNYQGPSYFFLTDQSDTDLRFYTYNSSEGFGLKITTPQHLPVETYNLGRFTVTAANDPGNPSTSVPEPASSGLMLIGGAVWLLGRRRANTRSGSALIPV